MLMMMIRCGFEFTFQRHDNDMVKITKFSQHTCSSAEFNAHVNRPGCRRGSPTRHLMQALESFDDNMFDNAGDVKNTYKAYLNSSGYER